MATEPISSTPTSSTPSSYFRGVEEEDTEQSTSHLQKEIFTTRPSNYWLFKEVTVLKDNDPFLVVTIQKYIPTISKVYTLKKPGDDAPILFMTVRPVWDRKSWSWTKKFFKEITITDNEGTVIRQFTDITFPQYLPYPPTTMQSTSSDIHLVQTFEGSYDIEQIKTKQIIWSIKPSTDEKKNAQNEKDLTITSHSESDSRITALYAAYFTDNTIPALLSNTNGSPPPYNESERTTGSSWL